MIRYKASSMLVACNVAITRWPDSAAFNVKAMVWGSRNSPTIMTSGSARMTSIRPRSNDGTCVPISRCSTKDIRDWIRYSIGSSRVTICDVSLWLISSRMEAIVVVLPQPVVPQTKTSPPFRSLMLCRDGWRFNLSIVGTMLGNNLIAREGPRSVLKILIRSRMLPMVAAKSTDQRFRNIFIFFSLSIDWIKVSTSWYDQMILRSNLMEPSLR